MDGVIISLVAFNDRVEELAALMTEFKLNEAEWTDGEQRILFRKKRAQVAVVTANPDTSGQIVGNDFDELEEFLPEPAAAPVQAGTPISSPMTGIYYASPSPTAAPFVKEGDVVAAGQVVGLIEAMKVFNEIVSNVSGTVKKVVAESGTVVNPGDPLLYIG